MLGFDGEGAFYQLSTFQVYIWGVIYIISLVGLLRFHQGARILFVFLMIVELVQPFLFGAQVTSNLDGTLNYLLNVIDGMLFVLIFFTPISMRFRDA